MPARRREICHIRTRHKMPPRRRAFRSNDFGLKPTTIPRDAKRQAEPPSRQGTHSHQNHFRFNPSRRLVEPHTRFAASNAQPRLNVIPRRDFPAHAPLPGVAALVPRALTPGYQALAPNGAAQGKLLIIIIASIVPEGHPLHNPTQATKKRRVGMDDGTDTLSITTHKRRRSAGVGMDGGTRTLSRRGSRHPRCLKFARREREALEKALFGELLLPALCHQIYTCL